MGIREHEKEYKKHPDSEENRRIKRMFEVLHYCKLTYKQEDIVCSLEDQFTQKGTLSDRQRILLSDIYERAENNRG
jgi:hypothetical protein